jgi:hypothetical protein
MFSLPLEPEHSSTLRSARAALARNRQLLRAAQGKRKRLEKKIKQLGIPNSILMASATIRALAPAEKHIARWPCLTHLREQAKPDDPVRLCLLDQIIDEFIASHPDEVIFEENGDIGRKARRQRAADTIAQYKLMEYVRDINLKQGIAPSSSQLIVRLQQSWPFHDLLGITNTGERIAFGSASGGRRFLANWRRRFGVTYGRLPPGSDLTAETIENQAGSQKRGTQKWNLPAGPHEAKETRGTHFWVPKSVSFSGTWKPKIGRKGFHFWVPIRGACVLDMVEFPGV